jgi:hypothetical protein
VPGPFPSRPKIPATPITPGSDLFRAFLECQAGITTLTEILARPGLLDRAAQLAGQVPPIPAPGRPQLLRLLS